MRKGTFAVKVDWLEFSVRPNDRNGLGDPSSWQAACGLAHKVVGVSPNGGALSGGRNYDGSMKHEKISVYWPKVERWQSQGCHYVITGTQTRLWNIPHFCKYLRNISPFSMPFMRSVSLSPPMLFSSDM